MTVPGAVINDAQGSRNTGASQVGHGARGTSRRARLEEALLPPLFAFVLAMVVGDLLILAFGQSPGAVYRLLLEGTWGNGYGLGQVLYKATTLTFTGLAFALAAPDRGGHTLGDGGRAGHRALRRLLHAASTSFSVWRRS
jgi:hypothetical protein